MLLMACNKRVLFIGFLLQLLPLTAITLFVVYLIEGKLSQSELRASTSTLTLNENHVYRT